MVAESDTVSMRGGAELFVARNDAAVAYCQVSIFVILLYFFGVYIVFYNIGLFCYICSFVIGRNYSRQNLLSYGTVFAFFFLPFPFVPSSPNVIVSLHRYTWHGYGPIGYHFRSSSDVTQ